MKSDLVDLELHLHAQTEKAVLVSSDGEQENAVWIPLSQVEVEQQRGASITLTMPQWLAENRKLV